MVNILNAVTGGALNYGTSMECDRIFKDWVSNSALNDLASQGEEENWGKFLTIGKAQQKLAKDVAILKSAEGNFETFVKALSVTDDKVSFHKKWIEKSGQIANFGKLLSQAENQKLLGLALSSTFGTPLRYCIQHEIIPSASYWNYYADQLELPSNTQANNTAVIFVGSCNPILAISRTICPLIMRGMNIVLVPQNDLVAVPCLLLGELMNKAGLECSVYAGSCERLKQIATLENIDVVVCGSYAQALKYRGKCSNLMLDLDGKKAVVLMETGDCDAAVDAAITSLKTSCCSSAGSYLIVQDSMLDDVEWRLRERFSACRSGALLDKTVDFSSDEQFQGPTEVSEYLNKTQLDVLKQGNARVVFNAQPSMPITQQERLGQVLLVFSYRSVTELLNLCENLTGLSELSVWGENQSVVWHVINQLQVPRIFINGFASYEPGFDHLLPVDCCKSEFLSTEGGKINVALHPTLDGMRTAQRSWANQGNKSILVTKFLKQLLMQEPFSAKSDLLLDLISSVNRDTGKVAVSSAKRGLLFDLAHSVGLMVIIFSDNDRLASLIRFVTLALIKGNAVLLSTSNALTSIGQLITKVAKDVGLPNVINTCEMNDENGRALLKHHGVRMLAFCGSPVLPGTPGDHIKRVCDLGKEQMNVSDMETLLVSHKYVWMATGEGLAN